MEELTCYEVAKDFLTIFIPVAIAYFVYRLTKGDAKRTARLDALYRVHEAINVVRYQHAMHEIMLEKQAEHASSGGAYLSNAEFSQMIMGLEMARTKLGSQSLLLKTAFHGKKTQVIESRVQELMLSRNRRDSMETINKLADGALEAVYELVESQV